MDVPQAIEAGLTAPCRAAKQRWTAQEDQLLRDAVAIHGAANWAHIATFLPNRNEKQARERWMNQLRPDVSKAEWTPEEDFKIVQLHSQLGSVREMRKAPLRS